MREVVVLIRFKVIKASHILLTLSVLLLAAVAAVILMQLLFSPSQAALTDAAQTQAKVLQTFASSDASAGNFRINVLPDPDAKQASAAAQAGRILIYHTHTHEAYAQTEDKPYVAVEAWRTEDKEHSVVRIGQALAAELRAMGFDVIHDTTDHEQQDLSNAYLRSLETLQTYDEPFDLIIDLHRDAYVEGLAPSCEADGVSYAQLMLLVGRGDAYSGADKPDYEGNLAFAQRLTGAMNQQQPGICRNVTVKKGRYNQHMGKPAILVEVGHNENTLSQALNSVPCLAKAIRQTINPRE